MCRVLEPQPHAQAPLYLFISFFRVLCRRRFRKFSKNATRMTRRPALATASDTGGLEAARTFCVFLAVSIRLLTRSRSRSYIHPNQTEWMPEPRARTIPPKPATAQEPAITSDTEMEIPPTATVEAHTVSVSNKEPGFSAAQQKPNSIRQQPPPNLILTDVPLCASPEPDNQPHELSDEEAWDKHLR